MQCFVANSFIKYWKKELGDYNLNITLLTQLQKDYYPPADFILLESKLLSLNPFLDEYNILRIVGRLKNPGIYKSIYMPFLYAYLQKLYKLTFKITTFTLLAENS